MSSTVNYRGSYSLRSTFLLSRVDTTAKFAVPLSRLRGSYSELCPTRKRGHKDVVFGFWTAYLRLRRIMISLWRKLRIPRRSEHRGIAR